MANYSPFLMSIHAGLAVCSALGVPPSHGEVAERQDLRTELATYLQQLCPVSALGTRRCDYLEEGTSIEIIQWIEEHYQGSTVSWRRNRDSSYTLDRNPRNEDIVARLFRNGSTTVYEYASRHASKESIYTWNSDLCPDIYFLDIPPIPFRHFLATAAVERPRASDAVLGASDIVVVSNPALEHNQSLRVSISRDPMRILQIALYFERPDGSEAIAECYSFSDWTVINGRQFPLRYRKDAYSGDKIWTTRSLCLDDVGSAAVPDDLMVPSGSTFAVNGHSSLVGSMCSKDLSSNLEDLYDWASKRRNTALFLNTEVDLHASLVALAQSRQEPSEVPLHASTANYECGPNCLSLAMALQIGAAADYGVVHKLLRVAARGVSVSQIADAAVMAGMYTKAIRGDLSTLLSYATPMLLPVKIHQTDRQASHFVLLVGTSDGKPVLMNPPSPPFVANVDWLRENWDGDALILAKAPVRGPWRNYIRIAVGSSLAFVLIVVASSAWKRRGLTA